MNTYFALLLVLASAVCVSADLIASTKDVVQDCTANDDEICGGIGEGEWTINLCCMHSDHSCMDDANLGIKRCLPVSSTRDPVDRQ